MSQSTTWLSFRHNKHPEGGRQRHRERNRTTSVFISFFDVWKTCARVTIRLLTVHENKQQLSAWNLCDGTNSTCKTSDAKTMRNHNRSIMLSSQKFPTEIFLCAMAQSRTSSSFVSLSCSTVAVVVVGVAFQVCVCVCVSVCAYLSIS